VNENGFSAQYRQQSAPMPPENLPKKKEGKGINNFVVDELQPTHKNSVKAIIHEAQKKIELFKVKSQSDLKATKQRITKVIEGNKFLQRIQDKSQGSNQLHLSKINSQPLILVDANPENIVSPTKKRVEMNKIIT